MVSAAYFGNAAKCVNAFQQHYLTQEVRQAARCAHSHVFTCVVTRT